MNRIILSFVVSVFSVTSLLSFASAATPVASYSFDEGQGTTLTDRSGNGNTGSLVNSLVWGTGKYGGSLTFNGSSGHVSSGDMSTLDGLTRVSVSAWVKTTATGEKHIIDKSNCNGVTNGGPFELGTSLFTSGKAAFVIYKNGGNPDYSYAESAISVTDGNWHYITGVYNGTAVQVYVDGTLSGQTPLSGVTLSSTSNSLEIGGNCNSYPYIWNGSIDDVRIYNTALTATEIQTDMNTPVGGTTVVTVTPTVTTPTPVATNGSCGSSANQTLSSSPTTNLCTTGTASSVTNSSSYTWSCTGTNGGVTASCSAGKSVVVIPTQPPVSTAVPSSIASMQAGQWMELPNTKIRSVLPSTPQQGSPLNIIDAWSGGTVDTARSRLLVWGGGHNDYWGNEMYALDLPTLSIKRIVEPSPQTSSSNCIPALSDGTPVSRHTYDGLTYLTHADSFFAVSGSMSPCGFAAGDTWVYSFAQNKWQQKVSAPSAANFGTLAVYDSSTQKVFVKEPGYNFFSYSLESNTYNKLNTSDQYIDYHLSAAIDSKRRKFVMIGDGVQVIDLSTNQMTTMQTTGAPAFVTSKQSPGIAYDPIADRIVAWHGGTNVYALNMDTGVWAEVAINQGPTAAAPYQGTFGRFGYIPQYGVFALINSIDQNAWVFKLSASTSGSVLGVSAVGSNKNNNSIEKISTSKLCTNITSNLHRGNETLNTRKLQEFLFTQGFLTDTPTGFYGDKTVAAVKAYQRSNNLTESGMVYEATRQMIKEESCGN